MMSYQSSPLPNLFSFQNSHQHTTNGITNMHKESSVSCSSNSASFSTSTFSSEPSLPSPPTTDIASTLASSKHVWSLATINPKVIQAEYAVRGKLALRAEELQQQLIQNPGSLPFPNIIWCNIGNPQQLGQPPITFLRQLSALLEYPDLLNQEHESVVLKLFPSDAIQRAKTLLKEIKSVGAYSHSQGIPSIRKHVAEFIERRDGFPSNPSHIFLTNGASAGIQMILQTILSGPMDGVLIPVPQYPIYTATLTLLGAHPVPYYLDESKGWQLNTSTLHLPSNINVKAICVIHPGNPTGNVLTRETIEQTLRLAEQHGWMVIADEVYQSNVYEGTFLSFKRVACELNIQTPVISFHSVSKGVLGECGKRGGYFECYQLHEDILAQLYKLASIGLCPAIQGQVAVDVMVNPPQQGDESYALYTKETHLIYTTLKTKAEQIQKALNELEGVHCATSQGAMYLFPKFEFPVNFHLAAEAAHLPSDTFYALQLLEATGICMVPGSGFWQVPGTFHLRTTFLPDFNDMQRLIQSLTLFHQSIIKKYKDRGENDS